MVAQVFAPLFNIEELVAQILMHRCITSRDLHLLSCALLSEDGLNEQDRTLIDRVFYGVRHGLLSLDK